MNTKLNTMDEVCTDTAPHLFLFNILSIGNCRHCSSVLEYIKEFPDLPRECQLHSVAVAPGLGPRDGLGRLVANSREHARSSTRAVLHGKP